MDKLYDPIREEWVPGLPEEIIRQAILNDLLNSLGYPKGLIAVEKELVALPHFQGTEKKLPQRRVDILCYASRENTLLPLLLIECKATPLTKAVERQITGYNSYVGACFLSVVNEEERRIGWYDHQLEAYHFVEGLPTYSELLASLA